MSRWEATLTPASVAYGCRGFPEELYASWYVAFIARAATEGPVSAASRQTAGALGELLDMGRAP